MSLHLYFYPFAFCIDRPAQTKPFFISLWPKSSPSHESPMINNNSQLEWALKCVTVRKPVEKFVSCLYQRRESLCESLWALGLLSNASINFSLPGNQSLFLYFWKPVNISPWKPVHTSLFLENSVHFSLSGNQSTFLSFWNQSTFLSPWKPVHISHFLETISLFSPHFPLSGNQSMFLSFWKLVNG